MSALVTVNPATGEPLAEYATFADAEVDAAAFEAHKATPHFAKWRTVAAEVVAGQVNTPGSLLVTHTAEESA